MGTLPVSQLIQDTRRKIQASSLVRGVRRSLPSVTRQRQVADGPSLRSLLCSSHWCIACIGASRWPRHRKAPKRHRISPLVAPGWLHLLPATYLTFRHSPMYIIGPPCLLASQVQSTYHDGCLRFQACSSLLQCMQLSPVAKYRYFPQRPLRACRAGSRCLGEFRYLDCDPILGPRGLH